MKRYNLGVVKIKEIDLNKIYSQYVPGYDKNNFSMITSPHYELAKLYYKNGDKWLRNNFYKTSYFILKGGGTDKNVIISKKVIFLFNSIKEGYLRGPHKTNYIVVLNKPFIESRYNVKNIKLSSPEVFMGHHRIGALLALGINRAKVVIAKDNTPGICECYGKIHNVYKKIKN